MGAQWLGWRPDVTPQYLQAETARRGLDLRERELDKPRGGGQWIGSGGDRRAALEKALEDQAWDRMFKEKELSQRGSLAREAERGRGERAEASQERLITANEKLQFKTWWKDAPEGARQAVLDDPQGRKVVEDSLGFVPAAERYEKPVKPTKMTAADLKAGKAAIKSEDASTGGEKFADWITGGKHFLIKGEQERIDAKKSRADRTKELQSRFISQFETDGIGANRRAGTADLSVGDAAKDQEIVYVTDTETGETRGITKAEARRLGVVR